MKTISLSVLFLVLLAHSGTGQERHPVELKPTQFSLSILEPSAIFELGLNERQSLEFSLGLTGLAYFDDSFSNVDSYFSLHPVLRGNFRHYYPRKRVKKELRPNSGNYVAFSTGYIFGDIARTDSDFISEQSNSFFFGPVWGIQRNYQSGIHLGLSLGLGLGVGQNMDLRGVGLGQFTFGFVID